MVTDEQRAEVIAVHERYKSQLAVTRQSIIDDALSLLREDIADPALNTPPIEPDAFMFRANQIGIALIENGFSAFAATLYGEMLALTLKYRLESGQERHAGALFANRAAAWATQGNVDAMTISLLQAADDDVRTYGVQAADSFAITGLLKSYFVDPVRKEALMIAASVNPALTLSDFADLGALLADKELAFLQYVQLALLHIDIQTRYRNLFSDLQILSALRSLSSLLEVELKSLAKKMDLDLGQTITYLFGSKSWWRPFVRQRDRIFRASRATDSRLVAALGLVPSDDDASFWKSLIVIHIVRNYTVHQLDTQTTLVQQHARDALGHILHVMLVAQAKV